MTRGSGEPHWLDRIGVEIVVDICYRGRGGLSAVATMVHYDSDDVLRVAGRMVGRSKADEPGIRLLARGHIGRSGLPGDWIATKRKVRILLEW